MNNNVYIMSIEAAELWEHMYRSKNLKKEYIGMLPESLGLDKLHNMGIKTFNNRKHNKMLTNDIINVKFRQKVKSGNEILKAIDKKILSLTKNDEEYGNQLLNYYDTINKDMEINKEKWHEIKTYDRVVNNKVIEGLRTRLYKQGFFIIDRVIDKKTGEVKIETKTEYVVLSRTSAKSRTGQVLFVKKSLRDKIIKWQRLGMDLESRTDIDFPGLLSAESLIYSSIKDKIEINPDNILIVDDVKSVFTTPCNVVEKGNDEILVSKPKDDYLMENEIFDGEGLLDSVYFDKAGLSDKGMMLLRQHMFKCCMFHTHIQRFLRDYAKQHNIDFNTWQIYNMFGHPMLAKDVHCIITPSSLKALKLAHVKGSKPRLWEHWKKVVNKEGNIFGICKTDEKSKRGYVIDDGKVHIMNQLSYQMLNSMPISYDDMKVLSRYERDYIQKLKNDDETYINYLLDNVNAINCNEMLASLYEHNKKIVYTKVFKDKRKKDIQNYINHVKKGKIRLNADYCTIIGNGIELLYHAIGQLPVKKDRVLDYEAWKDKMQLHDNEVYTTLHEFEKEYVACRNPHTAPSNVLIVKNKDNEFIKNYFKFSDNIIYTNAINFPIQRILSGQDMDSDCLLLINNDVLLSNANKCYGKYRVCVNGVDKDPTPYTVCVKDMAKIDGTLANSQKQIGRVVNIGQHYLSAYWDLINKKSNDIYKMSKLLEAVNVATILSEISIDSAKRMYNVDINRQIWYLEHSEILPDKKPLFFKHISQNDNIKNNIEKYETSMDYLQEVMDNIDTADTKKTINLTQLLADIDINKVKKRQVSNIINIINEMTNRIKEVEANYKNNDDKEKYSLIDELRNEYMHKINKYKLKAETMYAVIYKVFIGKVKCKYKTDLLNALYQIDKELFLRAFKKNA
ncbi:hypothetical protein [Clostridium thermosuccinogenes]|uniref:hypothetical protein n=1 Tax=Clostridium thermosuccinogenes TaxID=84032 RepID=UPI000CCBDA13|nr:hypothetical protein [Pseudoclostridium thermosuccinogenes]PNT94161.1 hypothetical protein CDQ83_11980 [Pseudoclostridium thermosuccinogenes]